MRPCAPTPPRAAPPRRARPRPCRRPGGCCGCRSCAVEYRLRRTTTPVAGRDAQIAVIDSAMADIAVTGTSVVLRGDPGMGKTALLKAAEATARRAGLRVLRTTERHSASPGAPLLPGSAFEVARRRAGVKTF